MKIQPPTPQQRSDWNPLEPEEHRAQLAALLDLLPDDHTPKLLDLGCGAGRTLLPLAALDIKTIGLDNDPDALQQCKNKINESPENINIKLLHHNFITQKNWPQEILEQSPYDLITCLGHTWMLITNTITAANLLKQIINILNPKTGKFVIDPTPANLWPCLTSGNWQSGIAEDNSTQIIWQKDDNIFALRQTPEEIDPDYQHEFKKSDRLHRLWTIGELNLLAHTANIPQPTTNEKANLIYFQPNQP